MTITNLTTMRSTRALATRGIRNMRRLPSTFIPTLAMPVFQAIAFSGTFFAITKLPGFPTHRSINWYLPLAVVMGSAFAGVGLGFTTIRDIEKGFFGGWGIVGGHNALGAGLAVGVMILPIVASLSEDALRAVPDSARGWQAEKVSVQCQSCKAVSVFDPGKISQSCQFCGSTALVPYEQVEYVPEHRFGVELGLGHLS